MTKLKKKLNIFLTILMIVSIALCLYVCAQVIAGREASVFGFRIYNILTGSMEPTIPTGTNILVHEVDPYTLEVGDIITFISEDAAIYGSANTHRIVSIETDENGERCFRTRGDANSAEDLMLVYPRNVKGKVVFHLNVSTASFFGFMHTKVGFATVILLPMMLIVGLIMRDFKHSVNEYVHSAATESTQEAAPPTPAAAEAVSEEAEAAETESEAAEAAETESEEAEAAETESEAAEAAETESEAAETAETVSEEGSNVQEQQ